MATLILAEKPDQARSYMKGLKIPFKGKATYAHGKTFLDDDTIVVAAAGHLFELCEPAYYNQKLKDRDDMDDLPIIPAHFAYDLPKQNQFLFGQIKKNVAICNRIIVATDKDDEGCAIAYNILRMCRALKYKKIERAFPSALNAAAVIREFKHLEPIDSTWRHAKAAIARSRSDWLIGMNISRLYTYQLKAAGIKGNFAVGRAISTTLNLICQWNESIINFKPQPVYELVGTTKLGNGLVTLSSKHRIVGRPGHDAKAEYLQYLRQHQLLRPQMAGKVLVADTTKKQQMPPILMTKGDLYREMTRVAGWTQARSKKVMQQNYQDGYQTYPRTDSGLITKYMYQYLAKNFQQYLTAIGDQHANQWQPYHYPDDKLKKYFTTEASAGAHLAIIPTEKIMKDDSEVSDDQRLMYEVVVRKSLTLLMPPYQYVSNRLGVQVNDIGLVAQNSGMIDSGWKQILLPSKKKKKKEAKHSPAIVNFSQLVQPGQSVLVRLKTKTDETKPLKPLRSIQIYDKGGLMEKAYKYVENQKYAKILRETKGIGTSATRDQAMASLENKKYVNVNRKDILTVTPAGWLINRLLQGSEVNNPELTAKWEDEFKLIGQGKHEAIGLINATAEMVNHEFARVQQTWDQQQVMKYYQGKQTPYLQKISVGNCPKCGSPVTFSKDKKHHGVYDSYECTNRQCSFVVFAHYCGKSISANNMKRLLVGKPTNKIKGLETRDHKVFTAQLTLRHDQTHDKYRLRIYQQQRPDADRPRRQHRSKAN